MTPLCRLPISETLTAKGFARIGAVTLADMIGAEAMAEWPALQASWDHLARDEYMGDGGTYRRRSYAVLTLKGDQIARAPHSPHYQKRTHNMLNGGVERWFQATDPAVTSGTLLPLILKTARNLFSTPNDDAGKTWRIELHQFRIEARETAPGLPTPEGLHRDGVDWVLMLAVNRVDVQGGASQVHTIDGTPLSNFTMETPFEALIVDDHRVLHAASPVLPQAGAAAGHRDVLVATFRDISSESAQPSAA